MNFAGKKLNGFYSETREISTREEKLLAENRSLKSKNKRLSTAMIYLVDQIEVRLPFWSSKPPIAVKEKTRPAKPKIIGESRVSNGSAPVPEPKKNTDRMRSQPLSLQQIFADKRKPAIAKITPNLPIKPIQEQKPQPVDPVVLEVAEPVKNVTNDLSLAPEEIILLSAPTKENAKDPAVLNSSENLVERVAKKTSLKEASLTYMAVSVASSPVPDTEEIEDRSPEETKALVQNKIMKEAMLRRVNRLRW